MPAGRGASLLANLCRGVFPRQISWKPHQTFTGGASYPASPHRYQQALDLAQRQIVAIYKLVRLSLYQWCLIEKPARATAPASPGTRKCLHPPGLSSRHILFSFVAVMLAHAFEQEPPSGRPTVFAGRRKSGSPMRCRHEPDVPLPPSAGQVFARQFRAGTMCSCSGCSADAGSLGCSGGSATAGFSTGRAGPHPGQHEGYDPGTQTTDEPARQGRR